MKKLIFILVLLALSGCDRLKGDPGANGYTSLIQLTKATVDSTTCASEVGTVVNSGLDLNRNSHLENSEISTTSIVCDGLDGTDGVDGTTPSSTFQVVAVHDPCGDEAGHEDEVVLEFSGGEFMSWYKNVGLFLLEREVAYETTDHQKCDFEISTAGVLVEL